MKSEQPETCITRACEAAFEQCTDGEIQGHLQVDCGLSFAQAAEFVGAHKEVLLAHRWAGRRWMRKFAMDVLRGLAGKVSGAQVAVLGMQGNAYLGWRDNLDEKVRKAIEAAERERARLGGPKLKVAK